jgi:hypothetical protein
LSKELDVPVDELQQEPASLEHQQEPTSKELSELVLPSKEQVLSPSKKYHLNDQEEEKQQLAQDEVEQVDEEVVEEEMETQSDNGEAYQPSDESGEEGKFIVSHCISLCPPSSSI